MQKYKRNSIKSYYFSKSNKSKTKSKSKSSSKIPSSKSSKTNLVNLKSRFSQNKINKLIKIQAVIRGYQLREIFNEVYILNKKLECFFFIVRITMFRHAINYDYLANKRIDYYSDHKNAKYFLLLQRRIRYFLFIKKIKILEKKGIFKNKYIITQVYRTKIKSKLTSDKYLTKPLIKYHRPLSKIIMIQRNYKLHAKIMKKINKNKINKFSLNKCPLITKEERYINVEQEKDYNNIKAKIIISKKNFFTKINYNYEPMILIQKKYKERYNYLKENYKLHKHSKLLKKVNNKHHYIYHAYVLDVMKEILLIQKNIKYFLYRRHSMVNLVKKRNIKKCLFTKKYEIRENVKKYFYEEFAKRLVYIVKKFFFNFNLKIIKKSHKHRKISSLGFNEGKYMETITSNSNENSNATKKRRNSLTSHSSHSNKIQRINSKKKSQKKDNNIFNNFNHINNINNIKSIVSNKNMNLHMRPSNLKDASDEKSFKERNSKKKVTFKSDVKIKKNLKENNSYINNNKSVTFKEESNNINDHINSIVSPRKQRASSKNLLKNKSPYIPDFNPYASPKKRK